MKRWMDLEGVVHLISMVSRLRGMKRGDGGYVLAPITEGRVSTRCGEYDGITDLVDCLYGVTCMGCIADAW